MQIAPVEDAVLASLAAAAAQGMSIRDAAFALQLLPGLAAELLTYRRLIGQQYGTAGGVAGENVIRLRLPYRRAVAARGFEGAE